MTRRTAVATLLRVAELKEAVARGAAGQAIRAADEAAAVLAEAQDHLTRAGLAGGAPAALTSTSQVRLWRAEAVQVAQQQVEAADAARVAALTRWTEERRRQRLFETLAARKAQEALHAEARAEQDLADELAVTRNGR